MTKLIPAVLALTLLAGASGAAMAQDHDHDRGGQAAPQQPHQGPPGGGHEQAGAPAAPAGGQPGGGHRGEGGQPGGGRWQGAPQGAQPGGQRLPGGDRRFQGGQPPAGPGGIRDGRDWNHDRSQVTPPAPEGRNADGRAWEGRRDPRGGEGRYGDGRGPGAAGPGFAGGDHDRRGGDRGWRDGGAGRWAPGRYPSVMWSHDRFRVGAYRPPYGYYVRAWGYGDILPRAWFAEPYWIDDFIDYDLPYPPPGFVWVRVGPDALMIDEYSGRVVQVVRGIFW